MTRPDASAAAVPTASPAPMRRMPRPMTSRRTSRRWAPRATRTPISRVRCATLKAITP